MAVTVPGRESGLRLGEARGPVQFGVGDIDVMVASQQPRPAPSAATATGDMHRGRVAARNWHCTPSRTSPHCSSDVTTGVSPLRPEGGYARPASGHEPARAAARYAG